MKLFRENLLVIVSWFLFFCFTSSVSGKQNKWPNSHHSHPLHPFITWIFHSSWMWSAVWIDLIGNPISACRLISWNNILPMKHVWLRWICMPSDFFARVKFSLAYTEIPWLVKLSLTRKIINFPGMVTHTNIVRRSEIQMFFSNIKVKLDRK